MSATLKERLAAVPPLVWLLLLTVGFLSPFGGKAFFTDDTLFLRAAQHIQHHPINFYGFNMNWFGYTTPMFVAFDNPPLTSYYIAFAAFLLGWSEWALHLAFLLPALAVVWGTFELAKNYCERPFIAALIVVLTPVFLISATSVMCDVTQLAFWVWSMVFFEKGLRTEARLSFLASGVLAGLAFLTKYLGLSLIPLLLAYGLCRKRRPGWWLVAPMIPLFFATGYEWLTSRLYGHGLLFLAAKYASDYRADTHYLPLEKLNIGFNFVGASFLPVLFFAPMLWGRRMILLMPCIMAAGLLFIPRMAAYVTLIWHTNGSLNWGIFFITATLTVIGIYVFLLAGMDMYERLDVVSVLLLLWLLGMYVFTIAFNWTIDARSLLPAVPAVGILAARRLDQRYPLARQDWRLQFLWPAFPTAAICLLLAKADCDLADSQRTAAMELGAQFQSAKSTTWFYEHSGFQYYIERFGAKAMEQRHPELVPGNIVISSFNAGECLTNSSDKLRLLETRKFAGNTFISTLDGKAGAGFYASAVGPLPFRIGNIKPQYINVYRVIQTPASAKLTSR